MKRYIRATTEQDLLDKEDILACLHILDKKLRDLEMYGEIDIFGGAVMCLGLDARESTHDIDAVFKPKTTINRLIHEVSTELHISDDWLNDGVKGFISSQGDFCRFEDEFTNLTVMMTTPEYLFAMKCLSCRMDYEDSNEISDIKFLIDYLNLHSVEEAEDLILQYYPAKRYKPKTHYLLEELFANK